MAKHQAWFNSLCYINIRQEPDERQTFEELLSPEPEDEPMTQEEVAEECKAKGLREPD